MNMDRNIGQETYLRFLVNTILTGMRIATLQTGELGWGTLRVRKETDLAKSSDATAILSYDQFRGVSR